MSFDLKNLIERGYQVVESSDTQALLQIISELGNLGFVVMRDAIIGGRNQGVDLVAQPGDFWFHSDGVFLETPPRWVAIQVLETEGGGALHVLDAQPIMDRLHGIYVWFGTEHRGLHVPVISWIGDHQCLRYRADYMQIGISGDVSALEAVHEEVRAFSANALTLGELPTGWCLVTDNWRVLHRREAFVGQRTIRRIWFGS